MAILQSYFPTRQLQRVELRMRSLLEREILRLQSLPAGGIGPENLESQLSAIAEFSGKYHLLYMDYLAVVLPQHREPVRCGAGCANCCHHYPMSVEPFELLTLYAHLRQREDFSVLLETCFHRVRRYCGIAREMGIADQDASGDDEERHLHHYYAQGFPCPFIQESGNCGVYAHRPLTCRMYFSHTEPRYCVPEYLQTPHNRSFIVYLPDAIEEQIAQISSFYEALELPESLYAGLLAVNALEGCFAHGK